MIDRVAGYGTWLECDAVRRNGFCGSLCNVDNLLKGSSLIRRRARNLEHEHGACNPPSVMRDGIGTCTPSNSCYLLLWLLLCLLLLCLLLLLLRLLLL